MIENTGEWGRIGRDHRPGAGSTDRGDLGEQLEQLRAVLAADSNVATASARP